jgi:hypothetical protein
MARRSAGHPVEAGAGLEMEISAQMTNSEFLDHLGGPHLLAMTIMFVAKG